MKKSEFNDQSKEYLSSTEIHRDEKELFKVREQVRDDIEEDDTLEITDETFLTKTENKNNNDLNKLNDAQSSLNGQSGGGGGAGGSSSAAASSAGAGASIAAVAVCAACVVGAVAVGGTKAYVNEINIKEQSVEVEYSVDFVNEDGSEIYFVLDQNGKEVDTQMTTDLSGTFTFKVENLQPNTEYSVVVKEKTEFGLQELARRKFTTGYYTLTSAMKEFHSLSLVTSQGKYYFWFDYIDENEIYDTFKMVITFADESQIVKEFDYAPYFNGAPSQQIIIDNLSEYLNMTANFQLIAIDVNGSETSEVVLINYDDDLI